MPFRRTCECMLIANLSLVSLTPRLVRLTPGQVGLAPSFVGFGPRVVGLGPQMVVRHWTVTVAGLAPRRRSGWQMSGTCGSRRIDHRWALCSWRIDGRGAPLDVSDAIQFNSIQLFYLTSIHYIVILDNNLKKHKNKSPFAPTPSIPPHHPPHTPKK
jgi:hypothetical protein